MNALVRNSTEKELLLIIERIATELELEIDLESFAFEEGGLREFFKLIAKKGEKNKFLTGIVAGVIISVLSHYATRDFEKEGLEKEKIKLEIEKLKQDLENYKEEEPNDHIVQSAVAIFNNDIKVVKHRSNFYTKLSQYPKVNKIETNAFKNDEEKGVTSVIERTDFDKFILQSDDLEADFDENAIIEIISPVLKKGNYKWRGIYLKTNEPISFYMKDYEFKQHVVADSIPFQNGSQIVCELEIERRVNEIGEIENHAYSVILVQEVLNAEQRIITEHSTRIKRIRKELGSQTALDFEKGE
jgi:uncharacterized membrane-anchored protein YhcB (DUF1043 family)